MFISAIQQGESAMKVKVLVAQSCPTFASLPGSPDHGIFQARIVEWVPFPSQGDLPDSGIELTSPALVGRFFTTEPPGKYDKPRQPIKKQRRHFAVKVRVAYARQQKRHR